MSSNIADTDEKYDKMEEQWKTCRDAVEGKQAIFEKKTRYLPKLDGMNTDEYSNYQMRAGWYDATSGTKAAFKGMIMRKPPQVDLPNVMEEFEEDATLSGKSVSDLADEVLDEVFETGRCGLLVDHEGERRDDDRPRTRAEVEQSNERPYITMYEAEDILPPKLGYVDNKYVVTQLRLKETTQVEGSDEFDTDYKDRIRVLDLAPPEGASDDYSGPLYYRVRVFEAQTDRDEEQENENIQQSSYKLVSDPIYPKMNGDYMTQIPFEFINAQDLSHEYSKPPLLGLAELNVDHYRTKADYKHGLHFTGLPTAVITGHKEDDKTFRIGSTVAWQLENPDADAKYLEFTGQGLEELRKELENLKNDMASLGARMLATEKRQPEAAESHMIKRSSEHATLASISRNSSKGITSACEAARDWYGSEEDVTVKLNSDFIPVDMSFDDVMKLITAAQSNSPFTWEDALWNLRKGERLDPSMDDDERMSKMQTEPPTDMNFNGNGGQDG